MMRAAIAAFALAIASSSTQPLAVRFHHFHYTSPDPAAAMTEIVRVRGGTRVVLQGFGVGVRIRDEYVLIDRGEAPAASVTVDEAVRWLAANGITAATPKMGEVGVDAALQHVAFAAPDLAAVTEHLRGRGIAPSRTTDDSAFFTVRSGAVIEITRDTDAPDRFWCPMHPDVRAPAEGKCPLCAMELVRIPPPKIGEYRLDVTQVPRPGGGTRTLRFTIREPERGGLVEHFVDVHERLLHLFIVSRDLTFFAHEHPVRRGEGFEIHVDLPPDTYMLVADFLPRAGTPQLVQQAIVTSGFGGSPFPGAPNLVADASPKTVEKTRISLAPGTLRAGATNALRFTVTDAATGAAVRDLEPYLGATGHLLIVKSDLTEAIHAHPEGVPGPGPEIAFDALLPAEGSYKMWLQIQREGRVITAPFAIDVK